jgi:uncharacterized protein (DUF2267 family)
VTDADSVSYVFQKKKFKDKTMTVATQTLSAMLEALPPREQESILDKIRPIIADAMDEIKWNSSYQKNSKNLEDFAQKVRGMNKASFDASKL